MAKWHVAFIDAEPLKTVPGKTLNFLGGTVVDAEIASVSEDGSLCFFNKGLDEGCHEYTYSVAMYAKGVWISVESDTAIVRRL